MIAGGWVVTGSWPITTERAARVRARDSAALASSIHLICRPRPREAAVGDWNEVLHGNKEKKLEGQEVGGSPCLAIIQCTNGRALSLRIFRT
jgi:adenine-specific DNA methylase